MVTEPTGAGTGADESLLAWGWCAVDFFAHVAGFFTGDAVGCQKTGTLFSRTLQLFARKKLHHASLSTFLGPGARNTSSRTRQGGTQDLFVSVL